MEGGEKRLKINSKNKNTAADPETATKVLKCQDGEDGMRGKREAAMAARRVFHLQPCGERQHQCDECYGTWGGKGAEGGGVSPVCPLVRDGEMGGGMPAVRCVVMGCNGMRAGALLLEGVFWGRKVGETWLCVIVLGIFMGAGCCFEEVMTLCIWARWTAPSRLHRAGTGLGWVNSGGHKYSVEEDEGAI